MEKEYEFFFDDYLHLNFDEKKKNVKKQLGISSNHWKVTRFYLNQLIWAFDARVLSGIELRHIQIQDGLFFNSWNQEQKFEKKISKDFYSR